MRLIGAAAYLLLVCATTSAQEIKDEYLDQSGYRLHLRVSVPAVVDAGSPAIVLESGGGFDAKQWEALQPKLSEEFRAIVVAYDRPGFGSSDLPDSPYDIATEVGNLHSALVTLELDDRVVFVAHSYGAFLAQL